MKKKVKILLVNDEILFLGSLKRNLRDAAKEWAMTIVDNGSTAIHLLDNNQFDVVMTDLQTPAIPGWNLLRHAEDKRPKLLKILLTRNCDMFTAFMRITSRLDYPYKDINGDTLKQIIFRRLSRYATGAIQAR